MAQSTLAVPHPRVRPMVDKEGDTRTRRWTRSGKRAGNHDALSRWYSLLADPSEGPLRRACLGLLRLQPGEDVLEILSGPGTDLSTMAERVGAAGSVRGLDLSRMMLRVCQRERARRHGGLPVHLIRGDGLRTLFRNAAFDVVLLSFTLELSGNEEIHRVLQEVRWVMRDEGRLGVVIFSSRHPDELATRVYWQANQILPSVVDCRPINAAGILATNGYPLAEDLERSMWGLKVTILVGRKV